MALNNSSASADPICGVATAMQPSAIAMLRISGDERVIQAVLSHLQVRGRSLEAVDLQPRLATRVDVVDRRTQEIVDDAIITYFPAPRSYTGEHLFELTCHGNPYIAERIVNLLCSAGVRRANPGEFTYRAYTNGKMDLSQAEGIKDLIEAQTDSQWKAAREMASGRLARHIADLHHKLLRALAHVEARIDFPEEGDVSANKMTLTKLEDVVEQCQRLISSFSGGKVAARGLSVVIYGEPNVGKSSLLNRLLDQERAIVSDIPGTTRDYLEEKFQIAGKLMRLIDTAGIRQDADVVEAVGIKRAQDLARNADVVLLLVAADLAEIPCEMFDQLGPDSGNVVKIMTKSDLGIPSWFDSSWHAVSVKHDAGVEELKDILVKKYDERLQTTQLGVFISNERHVQCLNLATTHLSAAMDQFFTQNAEIVAFELHEASRAIESILGKIQPDDVLGEIFSNFCVGK